MQARAVHVHERADLGVHGLALAEHGVWLTGLSCKQVYAKSVKRCTFGFGLVGAGACNRP